MNSCGRADMFGDADAEARTHTLSLSFSSRETATIGDRVFKYLLAVEQRI